MTSKAGATEFSATAEVVGEVLAPPTPTPLPTRSPADSTATAAIAVVSTAQAQGTPTGGTGACSPNQQPFVEPAKLTIENGQNGVLAFRDRNNACIMWYALEVPDWLKVTAEQRNKQTGRPEAVELLPDPTGQVKVTTLEREKSPLTIEPKWALIRATRVTEGQIVLREDDKTARRICSCRAGEPGPAVDFGRRSVAPRRRRRRPRRSRAPGPRSPLARAWAAWKGSGSTDGRRDRPAPPASGRRRRRGGRRPRRPLVARAAGRCRHRRPAAGRRRRRPARLRGRHARPARLRPGEAPSPPPPPTSRSARARRPSPSPTRPARRSPTIQEPAALFPGQFLKFVVVAPDGSRVLYVTAAALGMADAKLWVVPRGGPKALLKPLGDDFWVARPVWCQARPGDPGRIAYVMSGPVGADLTGLELWIINGDGTGDRRVLVGTPDNGFGPDLFYGDRRRRCASWPAAQRLRYGDDADDRTSSTSTPARSTTPIAPARPPGPDADPGAGAPRRAASRACAQAVRPDRPALGQRPDADRQHRHPLVGLRADQHGDGLQLLRRRHRPRPAQQVRRRPGRPAPLGPGARPLRRRQDPGRRPLERPGHAGPTWRRRWPAVSRSSSACRAGRPARTSWSSPAAAATRPATTRSSTVGTASTYKTLADYINPKKGYILKWLVVFEGTPPPVHPRHRPAAWPASPSPARTTAASTTRRSRSPTRHGAAGAAVEAKDETGQTLANGATIGRGAAHGHRRRWARASRRRASG